jgi:hypothetical protein
MQAVGGAPQRAHRDRNEDSTHVVRTAIERVLPAADQLCRRSGDCVCQWNVPPFPLDRSLMPGAGRRKLIVINRGLIEYSANEEEVAVP